MLLVAACSPTGGSQEAASDAETPQEAAVDADAMARLAGIWVNEDTNAVLLKVEGDSIVYADSTVVPARFVVRNDTLVVMGVEEMHYAIEQISDDVFYYQTLTGESIHLVRSHSPADTLAFCHTEPEAIELDAAPVERDTVMYAPSGKRYHLYVKVNPSLSKVYVNSYNEEGMAVRTAYYDNVVHIGVFNGATRICSHDFRKADFADFVPSAFYDSAVLANIEFGRIDEEGTHFQAELSQPESYTSYVVNIMVSHEGEITVEAVE